MKKRILIICAVLIVCGALVIGAAVLPKRPLKKMTVMDIIDAEVSVYPPGKSAKIDENDFELIADVLSSMQVRGRAMDEIEPIAGGGVRFEISTQQGDLIVENIGNIYIAVNGKYYRGIYEQMDEMFDLAQKLVK